MSETNILNYNELLKNGVEYNSNETFKFNDIGFKNLLATIATSKLHPRTKIKEEDYFKHIISIFNSSIFTMRFSKGLVLKFLDFAQTSELNIEYKTLLNKSYNIKNFIEDTDIDNFVSEEVTDVINLRHSRWYEVNSIQMLTNRVFKEISERRLKLFFKSVEINNNESTNRAIDELLKKVMKSNYSKMNNELYLLILRVFDYKHSPNIFSNYLLQSFAMDYRLYNVFYAKNIVFLRKTVKQIIDIGLSKKQTKVRKPRL